MAKDAATGVVLVMEDEKIRIAPALTVGEIPLECGQLITRIKVDSGSARAYDEEIRERHNLICAMNTIVQSMKSEDAYSRWMRVAPGKADEDDLETIAADDDLFKDCVSMFNAITSSFYVRHGSFVGAKSY